MKKSILRYFMLLAAFVWVLNISIGDIAMATDESDMLEKMGRVIQNQQKQIDAQAKALEEMKQQLDLLTRELAITSGIESEEEADDVKKVVIPVKPGNEKASVKLYGHINRAVMGVEDGDDSYLYQVDNSNSQSRFGIRGTIKATDKMEIGTLIEAGFVANPSNEVDQFNQRGVGPVSFTRRHLDIYATHNSIGKFYMGHGSTASDGTSEVDLSGTTVAGYSSAQDLAGGQFFYDNIIDDHSDTRVKNAFGNMDGLGRDVRMRYDTPVFYGFQGAASYIAEGGGDIALKYNAGFGGFKLAGALAYANPDDASETLDHQYNGSFSLLHESGFNATMAAGMQDYKASSTDDGLFYYVKLGYKRQFFSLGDTCLSIDYGKYEDLNPEDQGDIYGGQVVQNFSDWGTEYYIGYRLYSLDRQNADYEDINAIMTGFRVKF